VKPLALTPLDRWEILRPPLGDTGMEPEQGIAPSPPLAESLVHQTIRRLLGRGMVREGVLPLKATDTASER